MCCLQRKITRSGLDDLFIALEQIQYRAKQCDYTLVQREDVLTFDSYPVRNLMSLDLCRTPSLS